MGKRAVRRRVVRAGARRAMARSARFAKGFSSGATACKSHYFHLEAPLRGIIIIGQLIICRQLR